MLESLHSLEQVARLTVVKDRDTIDSVLVEVLRALLKPTAISLVEVLSLDDEPRCMVRAHITPDMVAPSSTSPWASLEDLDRLSDFSYRVRAIQARRTVLIDGFVECGLVTPVFTEGERTLLIEVLMGTQVQEEAVRLVEGVGRIYQNFLNLLDYSERDSLTSLLNRKSFDETFFKAVRPAHIASADVSGDDPRRGSELTQHWLGVIDVDHFKRVNDGYGHLIGDEVLLLMARIMRSSFRHDDRLYRFGGEEFVVLLRADGEATAAAAFERFRANVEQYAFPQVGRITASVGFTQVRPQDTPAAAFERADKAVYLAKAQGRNMVRGYERHVAAAGQEEQRLEGGVELF